MLKMLYMADSDEGMKDLLDQAYMYYALKETKQDMSAEDKIILLTRILIPDLTTKYGL